jgi:acetyl-CoA decarbonylase/synthase complex subunit beta
LIFYIHQVDGLGLVNRLYTGETPVGLPFPKLASLAGGGVQYHGFCGVSMQTIRSRKFVGGDGGWDRIVWMPKDLKEKCADAIPETHYSLIPTEEDTIDPEELKQILIEKKHPIVEKYWKDGVPQSQDLPGPGEPWPEDKDKMAER